MPITIFFGLLGVIKQLLPIYTRYFQLKFPLGDINYLMLLQNSLQRQPYFQSFWTHSQPFLCHKRSFLDIVIYLCSFSSSALLERLKKYVDDSAFCIYSCKIHGDFDFVCHFILDSNEQFDLEMDSFINQFSDFIADFRTFDSG